MKVTAIVPTFNRASFLVECLDSLLGQTVQPFEIIVVNDGSTDDTGDVLKGYGTRIKVIEKPNGGKSSALNAGLAMARGEWIWIFDDDDIALPHALETHMEAIRSRPDGDFTYSGYYVGESVAGSRKLQIVRTVDPYRGESGYLFWDLAIGVTRNGSGFMPQQGMIVRRRCYGREGSFDELLTRSIDLDMNLRLARLFKGVPNPVPTFILRRHDGDRGPTHDRHKASERDKKWAETTERVMRKAYFEGDLLDFERGDWEVMGARVPALLSRVEVMARWGIADLVRKDLDFLADALGEGGAPPEEWVAGRLTDIELRSRKFGEIGVACDVRRFRDGMIDRRRRPSLVPSKHYYWNLRENVSHGSLRLAAANVWGIGREVVRTSWRLCAGANRPSDT